jgi:hypothetical protein
LIDRNKTAAQGIVKHMVFAAGLFYLNKTNLIAIPASNIICFENRHIEFILQAV